MPRLLQFFFDNPILFFIVLAWAAGALGNVLKKAKKAQQAPAAPRPATRQPLSPRPVSAPVTPRQRSAEEVAAEMRRILGLEPEAPEERQSQRAPTPPTPPPPSRRAVSREAFASERPPAPVVPTTQTRHLEIHVDPHVGERIQKRQTVQSGLVGKHEAGKSLGSLGGRVSEVTTRRSTATRFPLNDLKRAFVINEILQPPLALRERGAARA